MKAHLTTLSRLAAALAFALQSGACFVDFPGRAGVGDAAAIYRDATILDARQPTPSPDVAVPGVVPDARPPKAEADAGRDAASLPDAFLLPDATQLPDGERPGRADTGVPEPELCNGLDDDLDGLVDEGAVCGPYIAEKCRVWFGYAYNNRGPQTPSERWGRCPSEESGGGDATICTSTRGDATFRSILLSPDVDDAHRLALAFTCSDDDAPEVAEYIQSACAVFLGHADWFGGTDRAEKWGRCPIQPQDPAGAPERCISSGYDGQFHAMNLQGRVDANDAFGVAFICDDRADPERAFALASSAEVFFGYHRRPALGGTNHDGSRRWGGCPAEPRSEDGDTRCVGSQGDLRFHRLTMRSNVGSIPLWQRDYFGVMLRARP